MHKLSRGILLAAIIIVLGAASQVVQADSSESARLVVILADRQALRESEGGVDLAKSFVGLASTLRDGQSFVLVTVDAPTNAVGPALAGDSTFRAFLEQVDSRLTSSEPDQGGDLEAAFAETFNLLGRQRAASESTVYLISGGTLLGDLARATDRLTPFLTMFKNEGWPIVTLSLPEASSEMRGFLDRIASGSGGEAFQLSVPDGFKSVADKILRDEAKGSLTQLGQRVLSSDEVFTSTLSIAPGTREATLLFFKQGPYGSLRLSNPSGFEASAGDRTESLVIETPHVVGWRLIDPVPGQWRADVRGIEGVVSGWHYAANKYSVNLASYGAVPLNEPTALVAFVSDGRDKVVLEDVKLVATITTPEGATLVHELKDDGLLGDSAPADGFFSATIPPVAVAGEYRVDLELSWPEFGHRISSQANFRGRAFPTIEITSVLGEELRLDQRSKVATLRVHVQGQPFAISTEELTSALASNVDLAGTLEVLPQRLLDQGRAWLYDVFFTPRGEGLHTLIFSINMEYAGRNYAHATDSIVLSSVMPAPPTVAIAAAKPVAPPAAPQRPVQPLLAAPSGFPWVALAVSLVVAVGLVVAVIYMGRRTRPYGYLYDDRDEPVVDFSNLRRHPIFKLLFRSQVRGWELGVPGLEGVSFRFAGKRIGLRSRRAAPTVRVNNQPLIGDTTIQDRAWIGVHGRLYNFFVARPPLQADPGVADDD